MMTTLTITIADYYYRDRLSMISWIQEYSYTSGIQLVPCRFKYNDQWYGGIRISANNTGFTFIYGANSRDLFKPFSILYSNHNQTEIINQEIYDSINTELGTAYLYQHDTPIFRINNKILCNYMRTDIIHPTTQNFTISWGYVAGLTLMTIHNSTTDTKGALYAFSGYNRGSQHTAMITLNAGNGFTVTQPSDRNSYNVLVESTTSRIGAYVYIIRLGDYDTDDVPTWAEYTPS